MFERIPFASFGEFLDMGGYAFNVWTVYLLFAVFLTVNLAGPIRRRRQIMKELQRRVILSGQTSSKGATTSD